MAVGEVNRSLASVYGMPDFGCRLAKLPYDSWFDKVKVSTPFRGWRPLPCQTTVFATNSPFLLYSIVYWLGELESEVACAKFALTTQHGAMDGRA